MEDVKVFSTNMRLTERASVTYFLTSGGSKQFYPAIALRYLQ